MFRIYKKEYNKASPNNSEEWKNESDFNKLKQDFIKPPQQQQQHHYR